MWARMVLCVAALGACGNGASGDLSGLVVVNGGSAEFASNCELQRVDSTGNGPGFGIDATDRNSDSGIFGVSLVWAAADVPGPGTYDIGLVGSPVAGFFARPHPTESSTVRLSSIDEGQVRFDDYDPETQITGALLGLRMDRDDEDETIAIEMPDASFVCER